MSRLRVAIDEELKECSRVVTLGVRPQLSDYSSEELKLLRDADIIFHPTERFVDIFAAMGKETFPSIHCYRLLGNKPQQTTLFRLLDVPHPRARVYYGDKQKTRIPDHFEFPLVAKNPFHTPGEEYVYLIRDSEALKCYNECFNPAYIQEYVAGELELRLLVVNYKVISGYRRRLPGKGDLEAEVPGVMGPGEISGEAVALAHKVASAARLSDVAVDMVFDGERFWIVELNFRHDNRGWPYTREDGIKEIVAMIERGEL